MRKLIPIVAVLGGCETHNEIRLLLGPDPTTLTTGFRCRQDASPTDLLIARAYNPATDRLEFQLIVDLIGFGGRSPGCRGEELYAACDMPERETCEVLAMPDGARRFCRSVALPRTLLADAQAARAELERQLGGTIIGDAPDIPVAIRAVATTQPCSEQLVGVVAGTYPLLDADLAVGCAYSCPVVLDAVEGSISLSSDTPDEMCEQAVRYCTAFPTLP